MSLAFLAAGTEIASAGNTAASVSSGKTDNVIVETSAYRWAGDTVFQDEFKAWAVSPEEIRSTYKARPGYYMPIEQTLFFY